MAISLAEGALKAAEELKEVKENLTSCFRGALLDIGESLVFYTPLDTGLASSNWNLTNSDRISTERNPEAGTKGAASLSAISSQVQSVNLGESVTFYNPVDYIDDLEGGYSRQAPAGMVTPTKARVEDIWFSNLRKFKLI